MYIDVWEHTIVHHHNNLTQSTITSNHVYILLLAQETVSAQLSSKFWEKVVAT